MNKRSISLILIIVFSLCIVLNTAQPSLALSTDQTNALNAYYKILSSFEWKSGMPVYPDDYGGEYIDGSLLYVWIVHKNPISQRKYEQLCEGSEYVRFLDAAYSLNELERLANDLMVSGKDYNISGRYVDRSKNRLCICVAPGGGKHYRTANSEFTYHETVEALTKLWQEDICRIVFQELDWLDLTFTDGLTISENTSTVSPRDTIELVGGNTLFAKASVNNAISKPGTLGFCGTHTTKDENGNVISSVDAVLTAGHIIYKADEDINSSGYTLDIYNNSVSTTNKYAETLFYKAGNNGYESNNPYGDYAICEKTSTSFAMTNKVKYASGTVSIVGHAIMGLLPVGSYVYCYGSYTGFHVGTVAQLNFQYSDYPVTILGLVLVNMSGVENIDSGGPVYTYLEVGSQAYGYHAQGTITGVVKVHDINNYENYTTIQMFYSPISYALSNGFSVQTS